MAARPITRRRLLSGGLASLGALAVAPMVRMPRDLAAASGSRPSRGGTLIFGRDTGPTQLDPAHSIVEGDVYTLNQIFEPLYITNPQGNLTPWLAQGHSVSPDGKTWTFSLRSGVRFSDGKPLAADDVVYSIQRAASAKTGPLSFLDSAIASLRAAGPCTVVAQLRQPWAPFLSDISVFANSILPKDLGGESPARFFASPVGTGPFRLQSWARGGTVTLERNPHYWQNAKPYLDSVVFDLVTDDSSRILQLRSGEIQIASAVPPALVAQLRGDRSLSVELYPAWSVDLLFFNEKVAQFADRHVRRAIAHALNQRDIVAATTFGTAKAAGSFFPPSLQYYDPHTPVLGHSLGAARAELAKSRYPHGFSTQLLIPSGNQTWSEAAQLIVAELAELGITVHIEQLENSAYTNVFVKFDYQMMINNAINDISDPDEMASFQIDVQRGGSSSFWTDYDNPHAIALVRDAQSELDAGTRAALYRQIQAVVAQDAPYVPLDYPPYIYAYSQSVHGFAVNPGGAYRLEDVWLD